MDSEGNHEPMMYYDRSLPSPSDLLQSLCPEGRFSAVVSWIQGARGVEVNARLETRKSRGDLRLGAVQIYVGRNAVLTIVAREGGQVSFSCHREFSTQAFKALPPRCDLDEVPIVAIINHLEQVADRPPKDDEGAVHAAFMCRYGLNALRGDASMAIDSEVQLGFDAEGEQTGSSLRSQFEGRVADRYGIKGGIPRKLDALAVNSSGELMVIEIKGPRGDLNQAVIQSVVHLDRFEMLMEQGEESRDPINLMIAQKQKMGLLPHDYVGVSSDRITPVIAMPDTKDGWVERWLRATHQARGQVGVQLKGMQLWRLDEAGVIQEIYVVEEPARRSWIDFVQEQQIQWKTSSLEPDEARRAGRHISYRGGQKVSSRQTYDRFIPAEYSTCNLLPAIREDALRLFADNKIKWWGSLKRPDGTEGPTNHLRSSQVHCVNTLMSLHQTGTLLRAVQQLVPEAARLIDLESNQPIAFEWIGASNYLGERGNRRGQYRTSIDAFIVAELTDGSRTGLFLEWKLTETYDPEKDLRYSARGTDRSEIYRPCYERAAGAFSEQPAIESFHFDPHDQLFRQALLANEVRIAGEFGVDRMMLIDCVPPQNDALRSAVPMGLSHLGSSIGEVWGRLLQGPLLGFAVSDPLAWMSLSPELDSRYGSLYGVTPPVRTFPADED